MKKGVRLSPSVEAALLTRMASERDVTVPVVVAFVGVGALRAADDAVSALDLGVGVLVVCRADGEARAHALDEGAEHLAGGLGVVVHHQHVGKPGAGPQAHVPNDRRGVRRSSR